jgi:hypothetical protein
MRPTKPSALSTSRAGLGGVEVPRYILTGPCCKIMTTSGIDEKADRKAWN